MKYIFCLAKICLTILHFVLSCIGIGVITFGCSLLRNLKQVDAGELHYEIPIVLIAVGMVIVLVSLLGIVASFQGSYWLSTLYSTLLLAIFCCQIVLIGYICHTRNDLAEDMRILLHEHFKNKIEFGVESSTPMDAIQSIFKCCGKRSFLDYSKGQIPSSCCIHLNCSLVKNVFKNGCEEQFAKFWIYQSEFMKFIGIFFAALELLGVLSAFIVSRSYKKEINLKNLDVELIPPKIMAYE